MDDLDNRIADIVLAQFDALPAKSKPASESKGIRGWVPLSGLVFTNDEENIHCVAIATGMKCLPSRKIPEAHGFVLHDWHAEVLAIRAFNHFLLKECQSLVNSADFVSPYVRRRGTDEISIVQGLQPFSINERLKIHMYCSEAPCGDASMELTMQAQQDDSPWPVPASELARKDMDNLRGREYFSELGIVRRKPSRPDSPPTLSKSCSDKLALKQCTSLLSSPTSLLISPENAYLHSLILPSSQTVQSACQRSFSITGRMKPVANRQWIGGYAFRPFKVNTTNREFKFSRRSSGSVNSVFKSSNISALWTPNAQEILINGVLQGRKQTDVRGGSSVCRKRTWRLVLDILSMAKIPAFAGLMSSTLYFEMKASSFVKSRQRVKHEVRAEALVGWIQNHGDEFELEAE